MPLVVGGILGMWFIAPLVGMADPFMGWITFGGCAVMMIVGWISFLWP